MSLAAFEAVATALQQDDVRYLVAGDDRGHQCAPLLAEIGLTTRFSRAVILTFGRFYSPRGMVVISSPADQSQRHNLNRVFRIRAMTVQSFVLLSKSHIQRRHGLVSDRLCGFCRQRQANLRSLPLKAHINDRVQ